MSGIGMKKGDASKKADAVGIDEAVASIDRQFGKGSVVKLGSREVVPVETISSGSLALDVALGVGGLPKGRVVEIFGPESGGKTTLALHVMANAQKAGGKVAMIDAEHALDPHYAHALGIDITELYIAQPESGEQGLEIADRLIRSGDLDVIVIDSVAALVPRAEIEGEMGDSVTGDTPVYIRRNGMFDIVPINSLWGGEKDFPAGRNTLHYRKFKGKEREGIQILTHKGWAALKTVIKKRNIHNKPIIITHTSNGAAKTTADHSLFSAGAEVSPSELSVGDVVDTVPAEGADRVPCVPEVAWLLGYFAAEGSLHGRMVQFADTTRETLDRAAKLAERHLCVNTQISTREYGEDNPRKPLHLLSCTTRPEVYELFSRCVIGGLKKVPDLILNATSDLKRDFLEGFKAGDGTAALERYELSTSSFVLAAGLEHLLTTLDLAPWVSIQHRPGRCTEFMLNTGRTSKRRHPHGEVKDFREIAAPELLWDLETEHGTFVGGVGRIVHHNSHVGLQARLMGQALRKITPALHQHNTMAIFINQLREKVGVFYGSPETTTGGKALKFYASVRLDVRRTGTIKDGTVSTANQTRVKVVKNKVAPPFTMAEFDIEFGVGISLLGEVIDMGVEFGILKKSGAFYYYGDTKLGQGRSNAIDFLRDNPGLGGELEGLVRQRLGIA